MNRREMQADKISDLRDQIRALKLQLRLVMEGYDDLRKEHSHLNRKVAHHCTDMHCPECDGPREDR